VLEEDLADEFSATAHARFSKIDFRWSCTVNGEMASACAISLVEEMKPGSVRQDSGRLHLHRLHESLVAASCSICRWLP
jgi:hypothetical protein